MEISDMHVFNRSSRGYSLLILLIAVCGIASPAFADNPTPSQMAFSQAS
jgi:hypothetical protein